jgi:hypothetical protein
VIEGPLLNSAFAGDEVPKSPIEEAIKRLAFRYVRFWADSVEKVLFR